MDKWHDEDAFWETMKPLMFDQDSWDAAEARMDLISGLLDLRSGAAVLDLGCGPGRYSLAMARRGLIVTGVDRTALYLDEARQKGLENDLEIEFVEADMREFVRPEAFDAVISMFTSFGYFDDPAENQRVLENAYRSLRLGGRCLLDLMGKEVLARIIQTRDWSEHNGLFWLQERTPVDNWSRLQVRWLLLSEGKRHEFNMQHWVYSAAELSAMYTAAGFESVSIFGGLDGRPYDQRARRLFAVGRKALS